MTQELNERIKRLLSEKGISKTEISTKLGIGYSTLWRRLNGDRNLNIEFLIEIAKILGITVSDLIGENGENTSRQKEERSVIDTLSHAEYEPTSLSYGYWGNVADNARDVAVSGDQDAIAYVSQMLKRALSLLSSVQKTKELAAFDTKTPAVTNMPVMVGKRNENNVTLATA